MDVVREFVRGAMTVHVLHHAAEGPVNGAWMARELARHGYEISPGTLYPLLHRLEAANLLTSHSRTIDGRARREYSLAPYGRDALHRLRTAVAELAGEVLTDANQSREADPQPHSGTAPQ